MPDEACDGRNAALNCQLLSRSSKEESSYNKLCMLNNFHEKLLRLINWLHDISFRAYDDISRIPETFPKCGPAAAKQASTIYSHALWRSL